MMHDGCMQEWFVCEDGAQEDRVAYPQEETCKDRLKDMYHEAHIQCVITYNADVLGRSVTKSQARQMVLDPETDITREQYLQVSRKQVRYISFDSSYDVSNARCRQFPAEWCKSHLDYWVAIVDWWRRPEAYAERRTRWGYRLQMPGPAHHQGSRSLPAYMDSWVRFY
jgi:hypothetical protein